jgi:hypothetical protein
MRAILEKFYSLDTVATLRQSGREDDQVSKRSFGKKAPSLFLREVQCVLSASLHERRRKG